MSEPEQIFKMDDLPHSMNRAVYKLPPQKADGEGLLIMIEGVEGTGNLPRNAASIADLTTQLDFEIQFEAVAVVAKTALEALKRLEPGEVEIEFGVKLGGSIGIPFVTKGEAEANFKVTVTWKK